MSKDSFAPGELLGTVRFVFDKTKTRTLNATQAYDTNPSQIVLASFPASATKKLLTKETPPLFEDAVGSVSFGVTTTGNAIDIGFDLSRGLGPKSTASVNVSFVDAQLPDAQLPEGAVPLPPNTAIFGGMNTIRGVDSLKSNTTKDIYYGAMTVATGLYRDWQGKYAVLKVDLLTNNAILRVYNS